MTRRTLFLFALAAAALPYRVQAQGADAPATGPAAPTVAAAPAAPAAPTPPAQPVAQPTAQPAAEAPADEAPAAGSADAPDDPSLAPAIDEAARELEEVRAVEDAVVDEGSQRALDLFRALHRAGEASPLHERLQDALDPSWGLPMLPDAHEIELEALAEVGTFDIERAKKLYDIPVEMQPLVAEYIRLFQTVLRKHFVRWVERSGRYLPMMRKSLRESGLPEDTVYLSMIESGFSSLAYSRARASGLWQFIEPTGRRFGLKVDFWVDQRRDPVKATIAAAGYLKELYTEFGDWRLAWAGYNAGAGRVRGAIRKSNSTNFWDYTDPKGKLLRKETKHYVPKLMAAALISKNLKAFGFNEAELQMHSPLDYEEAEVPEATDLEVIAKAAGADVETIKELNPELRRWCTPPGRTKEEVYKVRLPVGTSQRFAEEFAKIAPKDRLTFRVHRVVRGDTLSKIAQKHGSATEAIMRMNGLRDSRKLKLGAELVVPVPRSSSAEALAESARRRGFRAAPAAEEIPAAPPPPRSSAAAGSVRTVQEGGRTKTIYGVAPGDSLWSIAQHFKVQVEQLKQWNSLQGKRPKLRIGQEIVLYAGEATTSATPVKAGP